MFSFGCKAKIVRAEIVNGQINKNAYTKVIETYTGDVGFSWSVTKKAVYIVLHRNYSNGSNDTIGYKLAEHKKNRWEPLEEPQEKVFSKWSIWGEDSSALKNVWKPNMTWYTEVEFEG